MTKAEQTFTVLDGGMGRLLERLGAPFRLPEWSALSLIEAPSYVDQAHQAYVDAGAEIITTNSYALVPHMLGEARFAAEGQELAHRAGRIAREVANRAGRTVLVAGSLPPVFESYRPQNYIREEAPRVLKTLIAGLEPFVDLWLIETQSSTTEALTALALARETGKPVFVSYTLHDEEGRSGPPQLRSDEPVGEAVAATIAAGADAILFNCSQPEVMGAAIAIARGVIDASSHPETGLGVYANAFVPEPPSDEPYAGISEIRADLDPPHYVKWVQRWVDGGATIVGGCCGIGPEHIAEISRSRAG